MGDTVTLSTERAGLALLRGALSGAFKVAVSDDDFARIDAARETVSAIIDKGRTVYGVNTGFGLLAKTRIDDDDLGTLQRNLVLSHMTGVGESLPEPIVRLAMAMKVLALAGGASGVRRDVPEALIALIDANVTPVVPAKGSVGASGDLAPLAHIAAVLIGEGKATISSDQHPGRKTVPGAEALEAAGLSPLNLGPKEGLALLNGTQISTALALSGLFAIENVFAAALVAGSLSVDAFKGSDVPFDARIHKARGQPGQTDVAATITGLLSGSAIRESHMDCPHVQDPYSLRCQPQVMGAALDMIRFAATTLEREAIAVTDNPLIFTDAGEVLSGGNFHAEPVAMAADCLAIALAEIGNMSERRVALLMDPALSGLPAFLSPKPGLNSGLMNTQVTAAALASENKGLAHPASIDTIPTSANQEDHVSMATHGARRLTAMAENAAGIVAIELIAAAQGISFHAPTATSQPLTEALALVRDVVPRLEDDRDMSDEIAALSKLVLDGAFLSFTAQLLPSQAGAD